MFMITLEMGKAYASGTYGDIMSSPKAFQILTSFSLSQAMFK
jgi:hypothetical protein